MKTIVTLLTATMLIAGASSAMAASQGSNQATDYSLSVQASHDSGGAYASAREPGQVRNSSVPTAHDFQLDGR
jgi:hypothetical protein